MMKSLSLLLLGVAFTVSASPPAAADSVPIFGDDDVLYLASFANGKFSVAPINSSVLFNDLVGVGDVDGDGQPEIVAHGYDSSQVAIWQLNGNAATETPIEGPVATEWVLAAIGDVDGDGTEDLIWQHENGQVHYWKMSGGNRVNGIDIDAPVSSEWTIVGAGNFAGGPEDDIVWQHDKGQVHIWVMAGGTRQSGSDIVTADQANGELFDTVCDLNADGRDDVVLSGGTTGEGFAIWDQGLTHIGDLPVGWWGSAECG